MESLSEILLRHVPRGTSTTSMSEEEVRKQTENGANSYPGVLKYIDCPICRNKGYIIEVRENGVFARTASA